MSTDLSEPSLPPITSLTPQQRRVLGTMIEKALTVPESYPLTLKALTTGCNQKSARHPLTNYGEDEVESTIGKLRELGLAAVVHTESGRTERFRHYVRKRFSNLSEPQVAILGELLLRGRQPIGDLRSRATRMAPVGTLDSLEQLRAELAGMASMKLIQSDGPLEMRGVEVDHQLYQPNEAKPMTARKAYADDEPDVSRAISATGGASVATMVRGPAAQPAFAMDAEIASRVASLESACAALQAENRELREAVEKLSEAVASLREALGG